LTAGYPPSSAAAVIGGGQFAGPKRIEYEQLYRAV